jgi:hypothetical protein
VKYVMMVYQNVKVPKEDGDIPKADEHDEK